MQEVLKHSMEDFIKIKLGSAVKMVKHHSDIRQKFVDLKEQAVKGDGMFMGDGIRVKELVSLSQKVLNYRKEMNLDH